MRRIALGTMLASAFLLAACGKAPPPPPPPPEAIQLEGIDYLVIKDNKLYGASCNFVAEGGGMSALVLAQELEAIIKLKGKIVRIPADKASRQLPEGARTRYVDSEHILILAPLPGGEATENGVVQSLPTSLAITDGLGRPQFSAKGQVQCKPM